MRKCFWKLRVGKCRFPCILGPELCLSLLNFKLKFNTQFYSLVLKFLFLLSEVPSKMSNTRVQNICIDGSITEFLKEALLFQPCSKFDRTIHPKIFAKILLVLKLLTATFSVFLYDFFHSLFVDLSYDKSTFVSNCIQTA